MEHKLDTTDIRWKQRFQNLNKAYTHLSKALDLQNPDVFQRAGMIQFFLMTFELSWKTMKDYLEEQGFIDINSPRTSIKKAFEVELISQGAIWLECLEKRNIMAHVYNEDIAIHVEQLIRNSYYPIIQEFITKMEEYNSNVAS